MIKSRIIKFKEFFQLWSALPSYVKIRQPVKIFESSEQGYNLHNLYSSAAEFLDKIEEETNADLKSYHYSLFLVHTKNDEVFGAFVTAFPCYDSRLKFVGTSESFVFRIRPGGFESYRASGANNFFFHSEYKALTFGSGGDGPAIRIDEELYKGRTAQCDTFNSPILIYNGKKHETDEFEAKNFEVFIL